VDVSIRLADFVIAAIKRGLISKSEGRKLLDDIVEARFPYYFQDLQKDT
jgi:hypothetical protein